MKGDINVNMSVVMSTTSFNELNLLAKDFFERVFKEKNMISEEGQRREDHPHFQNTPVFRRLGSRLAVPGGGLKCDKCEKIFKNNTTLSKHRCTN